MDTVGSPFSSEAVLCAWTPSALLSLQKLCCVHGHRRLSFLFKSCGVWTPSALLSLQKLWCVDTVGSPFSSKVLVCAWTPSALLSFQELWCVHGHRRLSFLFKSCGVWTPSALLSFQRLWCVDTVRSPFFSKVVVCGHCRLSFLFKSCGVWTLSVLFLYKSWGVWTMSALLSFQKLWCVDTVGSPFFSKVVVYGQCRLSFLFKSCGVWTLSALLFKKKCRVWTLWALCVSLLPSFLQNLWCVDTVGSPFSSKVVACGHCHVTLPLTVNEALKCNTVHSGGDDSQSLGAV